MIQWIHRLLAYSLATLVAIWAVRAPQRGPKVVLGLVVLQIGVGAATVLLGLPHGLQAAHVALGAAVWAAVVLAALSASTPQNDEAPGLKSRSLV